MPGEKRSLTESEGDVSLRASVSEENRSLNNIFKKRRAERAAELGLTESEIGHLVPEKEQTSFIKKLISAG